jgi:hypothetical protein
MTNPASPPAAGQADGTGSERQVLEAFLDFHRQALASKVDGISDNEARERRVPSKTTLAGLIKHMIGVERGWFQYEQTCELSRQAAARFALDDAVPEPDVGQVSLRWIYVHMIEETARHVGHADILREQTDGTAGVDGDSAVTTWIDRIAVNAAPAKPGMRGAT